MKQPRSITIKKAGKKFQCIYNEPNKIYIIRMVNDNYAVAVLLRDKKALYAHIKAGGTVENWVPAYVKQQPTKIDSHGILEWNTILDEDWKDAAVVEQMEKDGRVIRGLTVQEYFEQAVDNYLNLLTTIQS